MAGGSVAAAAPSQRPCEDKVQQTLQLPGLAWREKCYAFSGTGATPVATGSPKTPSVPRAAGERRYTFSVPAPDVPLPAAGSPKTPMLNLGDFLPQADCWLVDGGLVVSLPQLIYNTAMMCELLVPKVAVFGDRFAWGSPALKSLNEVACDVQNIYYHLHKLQRLFGGAAGAEASPPGRPQESTTAVKAASLIKQTTPAMQQTCEALVPLVERRKEELALARISEDELFSQDELDIMSKIEPAARHVFQRARQILRA